MDLKKRGRKGTFCSEEVKFHYCAKVLEEINLYRVRFILALRHGGFSLWSVGMLLLGPE